MSVKQKYQLEFIIKSSTHVLYNMLSTPSGLSEWFADDVTIDGNNYTFYWEDSEEQAKLIKSKKLEFVLFQWIDDNGTDYFFEFKIVVDDITQDVALVITDFAEKGELDEAKMLWESQVHQLMETIGM